VRPRQQSATGTRGQQDPAGCTHGNHFATAIAERRVTFRVRADVLIAEDAANGKPLRIPALCQYALTKRTSQTDGHEQLMRSAGLSPPEEFGGPA